MDSVATALESLVGFGGVDRVAATAADAQSTESIGVNAWVGGDEVGHAVDVFRAVLRLVSVTWLTFAGTLVGGVGCDCHVAEFGQALRVKACNLFLHTRRRFF